MTELQRLARCLADDYQFECQGGPLRNCTEWRALCAAINTLAVHPPSGASPQAEMTQCDYCHTWRSRPCGEGCCWQPAPVSPVEPTPANYDDPKTWASGVLNTGQSRVEPTGASPQAETTGFLITLPKAKLTHLLSMASQASGYLKRPEPEVSERVWEAVEDVTVYFNQPAPVSPVEPTPEPETDLVGLVLNLQAHAREHGWQDCDEPIAALLALRLEETPR